MYTQTYAHIPVNDILSAITHYRSQYIDNSVNRKTLLLTDIDRSFRVPNKTSEHYHWPESLQGYSLYDIVREIRGRRLHYTSKDVVKWKDIGIVFDDDGVGERLDDDEMVREGNREGQRVKGVEGEGEGKGERGKKGYMRGWQYPSMSLLSNTTLSPSPSLSPSLSSSLTPWQYELLSYFYWYRHLLSLSSSSLALHNDPIYGTKATYIREWMRDIRNYARWLLPDDNTFRDQLEELGILPPEDKVITIFLCIYM